MPNKRLLSFAPAALTRTLRSKAAARSKVWRYTSKKTGVALLETVNILSLLSENPEGTFLEFASFNGYTFGTCDITGRNPGWEMHPDTDEFFYIIEGEAEITLLENDGPKNHVAPAGTSFVVPKGIWHKPEAPKGAKFIFFTPGESLQSDAEDPRVADAQ